MERRGFTTTEKRLELLRKEKKKKKEKKRLLLKGAERRFSLDHTFLPVCRSTKIHTFPFNLR